VWILQAWPAVCLLSGSGEFLVRDAWDDFSASETLPYHLPFLQQGADAPRPPAAQFLSLSERLGPEGSRAACAYAVAVLASEQAAEG
jgi:hypothetical protein